MKSGICDNIVLLLGWNPKSLGDRFDNCEFIDRCDGVVATNPCDTFGVVYKCIGP